MTCIVCATDGKRTFMGADRSITYNDTILSQDKAFDKIVSIHDMLIGLCGSTRWASIIKFRFEPPKYNQDELSFEEYLNTYFVDNLRETLNSNGYLKSVNGREEGGDMLIAYDCAIFEVTDEFAVIGHDKGYASIGSGEFHAHAAMFTAKKLRVKHPEKLCLYGLDAANEFVTTCNDKYQLEEC